MRIESQRQQWPHRTAAMFCQVQVLAALRKTAFTSDEDWKEDQYGGRICRLENGHDLYCTTVKSRPEKGWQWGIYDNTQENPEKRAYAIAQGGQSWGGFDDDKARQGDHLPTFEHARQQAENHYQKMFPMGTSTGTHDSGMDYSDLNSLMRDQGM